MRFRGSVPQKLRTNCQPWSNGVQFEPAGLVWDGSSHHAADPDTGATSSTAAAPSFHPRSDICGGALFQDAKTLFPALCSEFCTVIFDRLNRSELIPTRQTDDAPPFPRVMTWLGPVNHEFPCISKDMVGRPRSRAR